jgi:hypothetical protein
VNGDLLIIGAGASPTAGHASDARISYIKYGRIIYV